MIFSPRLKRPTKTNKFYIRKSAGGYSNAIAGKCKDTGKSDPQCDVLANCVGYACGRFAEIADDIQMSHLAPVNAEDFPEFAKGVKTGLEPRLGAVVVWQKGTKAKKSDGAGHVAIVECIYNDGSILVSQSGYNSKPFWTEVLYKEDNNWKASWMSKAYQFRCFIYNPALSKEESTIVTLKKKDKGERITKLQEDLNSLGYNLDIDGQFGSETQAAVKEFQKENNLVVDGSVGPVTQAKLTEKLTEVSSSYVVLQVGTKKYFIKKTTLENESYIKLSDLTKIDSIKVLESSSVKQAIKVK